MTNERLDPPKESIGDKAHALAKAGISSVPIPGAGIGAELFGWLVTPPLQARQQQWMNDVADDLKKLHDQKGIDIESLRDDPAFIDTLLNASRIAVATSDEEKRAALRNAILNSATPEAPDVIRRAMYLRLVDQLTTWHIRMLDFFSDPPAWFNRNNKQPRQFYATSNLPQVWAVAYPEMAQQADLSKRIAMQLNAEGLLSISEWMTTMSASGAYDARGTSFGNDLLKFIRSPLQAVPIGPRQ